MTNQEKMLALIEYYGNGNKSKFARKMGTAPSTVANWLQYDRLPTEAILRYCKEINPGWLVDDNEQMLREDAVLPPSEPESPRTLTKNEKLSALIEHFAHGNKSEFARMLGVCPSCVRGWETRDSLDSGLILSKLPSVSRRWLLLDEGNMVDIEASPIPYNNNSRPQVNGDGRVDIKSNLKKYIEYKGLKKATFESICGLGNGFVDKIGATIREEKLGKISSAFPDLNINWLIHDKGDMVKFPITSPVFATKEEEPKVEVVPAMAARPKIKADEAKRPRINSMVVAAGTLSPTTERATAQDCEYLPVLRGVPSYDYTIIVQGNSMIPHFQSGDEVAIRKVTASYIEWGKPHVVVTKNDGVVLKRIYEDGENLRMVSYNTEEYPAYDVPKEEILAIYKVVGMLRVGF
jgi:repressor LexA